MAVGEREQEEVARRAGVSPTPHPVPFLGESEYGAA